MLNSGVLVIPMVPTTPKRAFVLVSGFCLPSPCSHHLRTAKSSTKHARFRRSDCSLAATSSRLPYSCSHHLATPKLSTNLLDFGVLVGPFLGHHVTLTALPLPPQPQNPKIKHIVLDFRVLTVPWLLLPRPDPEMSNECLFRGCDCLPLPCHLQQVFPQGLTRHGGGIPLCVVFFLFFHSSLFQCYFWHLLFTLEILLYKFVNYFKIKHILQLYLSEKLMISGVFLKEIHLF